MRVKCWLGRVAAGHTQGLNIFILLK